MCVQGRVREGGKGAQGVAPLTTNRSRLSRLTAFTLSPPRPLPSHHSPLPTPLTAPHTTHRFPHHSPLPTPLTAPHTTHRFPTPLTASDSPPIHSQASIRHASLSLNCLETFLTSQDGTILECHVPHTAHSSKPSNRDRDRGRDRDRSRSRSNNRPSSGVVDGSVVMAGARHLWACMKDSSSDEKFKVGLG